MYFSNSLFIYQQGKNAALMLASEKGYKEIVDILEVKLHNL